MNLLNLTGASKRTYEFFRLSGITTYIPYEGIKGGIFCFTRKKRTGVYHILYISRAYDFKTSIGRILKKIDIEEHKASHMFFHLDKVAASRKAKEIDLIKSYKPIYNKQLMK